MVQYITTPWRSRASLLQVRDALYPSASSTTLSPEDIASRRREAIARVSIWAQRGNCPHLVESTALLSAAILNDDPRNEAWCVRAVYASSFSRFVTGLLDSHQTAKRKISMYALARTLGLPATFVELRHQATHEELPSLSKLRSAARRALVWIWDRYWVELSSLDRDESGVAENEPGDEDLRAAVRRVVRNGDAERAWEKLRGGKWCEEEVLEALMDVREEEEERDPEALLRAVKMSRRVLGGERVDEGEKSRSLEDIRRELSTARDTLGQESEDEDMTMNTEPTPIADDKAEGWAMWEGPWTPAPIGTIRR